MVESLPPSRVEARQALRRVKTVLQGDDVPFVVVPTTRLSLDVRVWFMEYRGVVTEVHDAYARRPGRAVQQTARTLRTDATIVDTYLLSLLPEEQRYKPNSNILATKADFVASFGCAHQDFWNLAKRSMPYSRAETEAGPVLEVWENCPESLKTQSLEWQTHKPH